MPRLTDTITDNLKSLAVNKLLQFEHVTTELGLTAVQKERLIKSARQLYIHNWVMERLSDEAFTLPLCDNFEQWAEEINIKIYPKERMVTVRIK